MTTARVTARNIDYDVDHDYDEDFDSDDMECEGDLPLEVSMIIYDIHDRSEMDVMQLISDEISKVTGFCHNGFDYDVEYI